MKTTAISREMYRAYKYNNVGLKCKYCYMRASYAASM